MAFISVCFSIQRTSGSRSRVCSRLAPFHILATEGRVHTDRPHDWHLEQIAAVAAHGAPVVVATPLRVVGNLERP